MKEDILEISRILASSVASALLDETIYGCIRKHILERSHILEAMWEDVCSSDNTAGT